MGRSFPEAGFYAAGPVCAVLGSKAGGGARAMCGSPGKYQQGLPYMA